MNHSVAQRAPIDTHGALQGPLDADKLTLQLLTAHAHDRVTMTGEVQKPKVRREAWIREPPRRGCIVRA